MVSKILARQGDWRPSEKNKPDILVWKQDWEMGGANEEVVNVS